MSHRAFSSHYTTVPDYRARANTPANTPANPLALTGYENPDRIAISHLIGDIGDYTLPIVLVNE
jgi:hypothetical protein